MRSAGFFGEFQADGRCKVEQWSVWNSCNFTSLLTPSYWINSGCQSCQLEPATSKQLSSQSATQQLRSKPHTSALPTGTFTSLDFNFEQTSLGRQQQPWRMFRVFFEGWNRKSTLDPDSCWVDPLGGVTVQASIQGQLRFLFFSGGHGVALSHLSGLSHETHGGGSQVDLQTWYFFGRIQAIHFQDMWYMFSQG